MNSGIIAAKILQVANRMENKYTEKQLLELIDRSLAQADDGMCIDADEVIDEMLADIMTEANELDSTCGISDDELTERFKASIRIDNEIRRIKGAPTAKYDIEKKQAYLEYPDGRIEYVE